MWTLGKGGEDWAVKHVKPSIQYVVARLSLTFSLTGILVARLFKIWLFCGFDFLYGGFLFGWCSLLRGTGARGLGLETALSQYRNAC